MNSKYDKNLERYSRQIILKKFGVLGQNKLKKSNIMIVGAGGLGSPAAIYLAGMGIGEIGIIDNDKVQISNIHRQILFNETDIKKNKAKTASLSDTLFTRVWLKNANYWSHFEPWAAK